MRHIAATGVPASACRRAGLILVIPEGCQLLGLRFITGALYLDCLNDTTPIVPASDFVDFPTRIMIGDFGPKGSPRTQLDANGGAPIFEFPDDSFIQIFAHGQPGISGNPIYRLGENALVLLRQLPDSILGDNSFDGPASSEVIIGLEEGGAVSGDPVGGFAGSFNINNLGPGGIHTFGNVSIAAAGDTRYLKEGAGPSRAGTTPVRGVFPRDGIVRNLTAMHNRAAGDDNRVDYTVEINGAPTALTVSLATGAIGSAINTTDFIIVAAGDTYALRVTKAANIGDGTVVPVASFDFAVVQFP